jgi:hypothetical protein
MARRQQVRRPLPAGREPRRSYPRYLLPAVIAGVVVIVVVVFLVLSFAVGGRTTRSKTDTGTVGRVGTPSGRANLPGKAPAGGIAPHSGGTTP